MWIPLFRNACISVQMNGTRRMDESKLISKLNSKIKTKFEKRIRLHYVYVLQTLEWMRVIMRPLFTTTHLTETKLKIVLIHKISLFYVYIVWSIFRLKRQGVLSYVRKYIGFHTYPNVYKMFRNKGKKIKIQSADKSHNEAAHHLNAL